MSGKPGQKRPSQIPSEFADSGEMKWARWFYDHRSFAPEAISFSLLGAANALDGKTQWVVVVLGVVAGVITLFLHTRSSQSISELQEERDGLENKLETAEAERDSLVTQVKALQNGTVDLLDRSLEGWATIFDLGDTERVTVYLHRADSKIFEGKARHSLNPDFASFRREVYQDDQGCLGKALRHGTWIEKDMPDPMTSSESWGAVQYAKTGLDTTVSAKMRMKAREIGAFAIGQPRRVGVVVVESTRTNVLDFDWIESTIEQESKHLADILGMIRDHTEDSRSAAKDGF